MPIDLPEWISRELGIEPSYEDVASFRTRLELIEGDLLGVFSVDDFVSVIEREPAPAVELVPIVRAKPWRFAEVVIGGNPICEVAEVGALLDGSAPSRTLQLVLCAWFSDESLDPRLLGPNHENMLLIGWKNVAQKIPVSLVVGLVGIETPNPLSEPDLTLLDASSVVVSPQSWIAREQGVYGELMQGVIRNRAPALRYLYLYRLFERAYLIDALDKLQKDFFGDPKAAIKRAENVISNEKSSFLALIEGTATQAHFEQIDKLFLDNDATLSNRFMLAVKQGATDDNDLGQKEAWKRGCVLAYKVRCSIVHSGKSAPIFESFPDASAACVELNKVLLPAAMSFLELTAA